MERIQLTTHNLKDAAARAAAAVRAGGVILYPTDTLYGLGADALSDTAVGKVVALKGRDEKKPIHAIVTDIGMAERFAEVPKPARTLAECFGGQVTLVCRKKAGVNTGIAKGIGTFGFRIPDSEFCITLTRLLNGPITATSANRAGEIPEATVGGILAQLGAEPDLVVDAGPTLQQQPSTVVDLTGAEPVIIREGAISAEAITRSLAT